MKKNKITFNTSFCTNKGIRPLNEDAGWVGKNKAGQLFAIICDGIGSQDDSQIASLLVVETFQRSFSKKNKIWNKSAWFRKNLNAAHQRISKVSVEKLNSKKIGTTLVAAIVTKNKVDVFNLGDSRFYHYSFSDNAWNQITKDHNLYNYLLQINAPEQSFYKNKASLLALTKYLESSTSSHLDYDHFKFTCKSGDIFFLASDGVYNYLKPDFINTYLANNRDKPFEILSKVVVGEALDNMSNDNLSAITIEYFSKNGNK